MKKFLSLALACIMLLSSLTVVFADEAKITATFLYVAENGKHEFMIASDPICFAEFSSEKKSELVNIAKDKNDKAIEDLKQYLKAIIQQYNNRLIENRLNVDENI